MSTHPPLDPNRYGRYRLRATFDLEGAHIEWVDVPWFERDRILPTIQRFADKLGVLYETMVQPGEDFIYMELKFRSPPDDIDVRIIKGVVSAIEHATSWGGPG